MSVKVNPQLPAIYVEETKPAYETKNESSVVVGFSRGPGKPDLYAYAKFIVPGVSTTNPKSVYTVLSAVDLKTEKAHVSNDPLKPKTFALAFNCTLFPLFNVNGPNFPMIKLVVV